MSKGVIETVTMFGTVAFAATAGYFGLTQLLAGETLIGAAFLGIAVLMVVLEEYVITPGDVAGSAAETAAETIVEDPDED